MDRLDALLLVQLRDTEINLWACCEEELNAIRRMRAKNLVEVRGIIFRVVKLTERGRDALKNYLQ